MDDFDDALAAFGFEIASPPAPNGNGYHPIEQPGHFKAVCFGCGAEFDSKRHPSPTRRSWCDGCRAAKVPGAQRVRDFRQRRHSEV